MFDILQEILLSHPFLISRYFETQGYQWHGAKQIKSILEDKRISGTGLQVQVVL